MDLPDNIFDDFDFNHDVNDEVITSCNKVKKDIVKPKLTLKFNFPIGKIFDKRT